jgi:phthiocerol/phenolphthiocerol synthesis type-I polyketide synthase E
MRRKFYTVLRSGEKALTIVPVNTRMVPLQAAGTKPPFFMVDSYPHFIEVAKLLGSEQPTISLIGHEDMLIAGNYSLQAEAARHILTILEHQPTGPYMLGGCSASGLVAYEIAQQMCALGRQVNLLVLFDVHNPHYMREYSAFRLRLNSYRDDLHQLRALQIPGWVATKFRDLILEESSWLRRGSPEQKGSLELDLLEARIQMARKYYPLVYYGKVLLFKRHRELTGCYRDPQFGWGDTIRGDLELCQLNAIDHLEIFKSEFERILVARKLRAALDKVVARFSAPQAIRRSERTFQGQMA